MDQSQTGGNYIHWESAGLIATKDETRKKNLHSNIYSPSLFQVAAPPMSLSPQLWGVYPTYITGFLFSVHNLANLLLHFLDPVSDFI